MQVVPKQCIARIQTSFNCYNCNCIINRLSECIIIPQMTLWSMAKAPLMYAGDVRKIDPSTYDVITNPTLLEINSFSSNNMEACEPSIFFGMEEIMFLKLMSYFFCCIGSFLISQA